MLSLHLGYTLDVDPWQSMNNYKLTQMMVHNLTPFVVSCEKNISKDLNAHPHHAIEENQQADAYKYMLEEHGVWTFAM